MICCQLNILTCPCAIAPITTTKGSSFITSSLGWIHLSALNDIHTFLQPTGRWSVMGFLMTLSSFWVPPAAPAALMLSLCNNCTGMENHMIIRYIMINRRPHQILWNFLRKHEKGLISPIFLYGHFQTSKIVCNGCKCKCYASFPITLVFKRSLKNGEPCIITIIWLIISRSSHVVCGARVHAQRYTF